MNVTDLLCSIQRANAGMLKPSPHTLRGYLDRWPSTLTQTSFVTKPEQSRTSKIHFVRTFRLFRIDMTGGWATREITHTTLWHVI